MSRIRWFMCLVFFVAAVSMTRAERPVYTLDACLEIGLREASAMRNAQRDRKAADSVIDQVRAQFLPQVSADGTYTRLDKLDSVTFGDQEIEIGSLDNYSLSVNLRQLVYSGGSVSAALDAAREYRIMADIEVDRVQAGLARDIRAQFTDILFLQAALEVNAESVRLQEDTLRQTQMRQAQDLASEFDVLNAKVQLANARPGLIQASNRVAMAKTAFADLLNLPDEPFDLAGALGYEPLEIHERAWIRQALQNRPELAVARQGLSLRETEIRAEQSAYRPALSLSANYGAQRSPLSFGDGDDLDWRWSATLQAQWQWLDGGLRRSRIREKRIERDKTLEDIDTLKRRVALEVRQACQALQHAEAAVHATRETTQLAEKSMEIAQVRYRNGLVTRLELSEVHVALMTARLLALEALRDHAQARTQMRFATGTMAQGQVDAE